MVQLLVDRETNPEEGSLPVDHDNRGEILLAEF